VPAEVTPDGSPVEIYRRLPAAGEAEVIHDAVAADAAILELGCGAGRITHELLRLGHPVTAVDESAEMLAHVRGAELVCARIEELDLRRTFDCVVLASHFVNESDLERRRRLLEVCARHVSPSGSVLVESYAVDFDWGEAVGVTSTRGDVAVTHGSDRRGTAGRRGGGVRRRRPKLAAAVQRAHARPGRARGGAGRGRS
jgi:SAM-dependent methyltransferase